VHTACLAAISRLGWTIAGVAETRITCQELIEEGVSALSPVRVAVVLAAEGDEVTEATLHGVSFGYEPLQSARVRERVQQLLCAIVRELGEATLVEPRVEKLSPTLPQRVEAAGDRLPLLRVAVGV
jgi:hypothetical protein